MLPNVWMNGLELHSKLNMDPSILFSKLSDNLIALLAILQ